MSRSLRPKSQKPRFLALAVLILIGVAGLGRYLFVPAYGAQLGNRTLQLSDDQVSAKADYLLSFKLSTAGMLGSVSVQFCSNDPFPEDSCTVPAGLDVSSAVLSSQSGPGGFAISPATTANELVLSRSPSTAIIGSASFHFTGVTNPSAAGSYYARVQTFATGDATGPASDYGGIAFAIANSLAISAEVPPYLTFCTGITIAGLDCTNASGDYIDLGELSSQRASSGSSQMLVATNAVDGYDVSVQGTTLTSGNNIINALASNDVSRPGVSQFGFNLRANSTPAVGNNPTGPGVAGPQSNYNQPNSYRFVSGDTIIANAVPDDRREYTASYVVNVSATQAPGVYVSTLTYICLASF
jgi:hypothetical protein